MTVSSAYIHVPFCRHRCGYCDFTLIAGRDDLVPAYLAGLARELRSHPSDHPTDATPLETLFLGGGTPTHPGVDDLRRLFAQLRARFTWTNATEVSVEANPLDLDDAKLDLLTSSGVNRISLGVQSFSAAHLATLERDHRPADLETILPRVRAAIPNVAVDLIFGIPGQTLADWERSLDAVLAQDVAHVSTYGLTFESGTAFETRRLRGQLAPVAEELERAMYGLAMDRLTAAGFVQYEISNFARPGRECRHNLVYWDGGEYHAYGPGAARFHGRRRETNVRSVLGWLAKLDRGERPVGEREDLSDETWIRERIFLGLRKLAGIDLADFARRTGRDLESFAAEAVGLNLSRGWLERTASHLRLTREGCFVADRVVTEFL